MNKLNYSNIGYYSRICGMVYDLELERFLDFSNIWNRIIFYLYGSVLNGWVVKKRISIFV